MDVEKITTILLENDFVKISNKSRKFEQGSIIYSKKIEDNLFLLFVILKDKKPKDIHAFIARFDRFESIGVEEPGEIMFYLLISTNEDFHYFEKYLTVSNLG
ncbi:hypothetical protein [Epilithonimonas arachidiradicis]|uniref:Uncharacterized protein n=1 Tax=Epilithonimonas arachidiradicis TaxID=1617282 RepID=A0A420D8L6_9FLAO|nr:hypothetical protein [Epilithonimonas arachidiradicis]RKE87197.1 hypothetical protein BXY58_2073 [Epilithonimonas arachidiradicis]GGG59086.1 hypothetical protein GCM10007332_20900 [Epilithonimonas arachidiradicis]